ncbi:MAG TPA: hypothetical protein VIN60_08840 [Anaerolineales bacterium]
MVSRQNSFLLLVGIILFAASLACGFSGAPSESAGSLIPEQTQIALLNTQEAVAVTATAEVLPLIVGTQPIIAPTAVPQPAIPEYRRLTLEYPPNIRVGDSDVVRLTLEMDTLGNVTPTAEVQGNIVSGKIVQIPNIYDTHNVFAEARFDIAGLNVQPPDIQSESLTQGQLVTFYWSVQPKNAGTFRGTIWFYLRFVDKISGEESRETISAQPVQIDANNFLGLSGGIARVAGGIGSIISAVLGFPFASDILKWLYGRVKKSV